MKLQPHTESGNSTVYSRLVISDEQMSPVDARRVILIDGQTDSEEVTGVGITLGSYAILLSLLAIVALLSWTVLRSQRNEMKDEVINDESTSDI